MNITSSNAKAPFSLKTLHQLLSRYSVFVGGDKGWLFLQGGDIRKTSHACHIPSERGGDKIPIFQKSMSLGVARSP